MSKVGGGDLAVWLLDDIEKRIGQWWDRQGAGDQIYFVQYLRIKAGMQYIVCPRWDRMERPAQQQFMTHFEHAIGRALRTLADATRAGEG